MTGNYLCTARIFHKRLHPAVNAFTYSAYYLCFPLSAIASLRRPLLSLDRFNLFSFHRKDHGPCDGSPLEPWIRDILNREAIESADGEIILMCHPRLLGYAFNPVSFWFCCDAQGNLRAVLAEVNNTFGERHCYLMAHADRRVIAPSDVLEAKKIFHVSPFLPVEGEYRFRFALCEMHAAAYIDYHHCGAPQLLTFVRGNRRPLTTASLLKIFFTMPLMTFMVVYRIHRQALNLWLKKVRFFRKPPPPAQMLSR